MIVRRVLGLTAVFVLIVVARSVVPAQATAATAAMALGFVLLVSYGVGRSVTRFGLPTISGYILCGLLVGPYMLGWLHPSLAVLGHSAVANLRLLDALALGLIALTAGGELRVESVRRNLRAICLVILGQVVLVLAGIFTLVWLGSGVFPSLEGFQGGGLVAAALLFGVIATANSPATALAIIQEYRSRGPVTDLVLAVTVVKDVVVISLFTIALSFAVLLARPDASFDGGFLLQLVWEVTGSIGLGLLLGWLVAQYLAKLGQEMPLVILGVAFVAMGVLPSLHLSGLLALMVAGFYIENFSPHGDDLIKAIERHSLPVYVVFFTIAGASLDLGALGATLPLALALAVSRGLLTAAGTALGAHWAGAHPTVARNGWSGFMAQAGVTLGFAILIEQRFPEIGTMVKTVTLAVIALNQLVGPVLFRLGLFRAGEARTPES